MLCWINDFFIDFDGLADYIDCENKIHLGQSYVTFVQFND